MANIAIALHDALIERRRSGVAGQTAVHPLASGAGWSVADVLCTCDRTDRPYEEQHAQYAVAFVVAGTFRHRTVAGRALMTPGTVMLGTAGHGFQCSHESGRGDRCLAFWFSSAYLGRLGFDGGVGSRFAFSTPALPAIRETSKLWVQATTALLSPDSCAWDELAADTAARMCSLASARQAPPAAARSEARVADVVALIDSDLRGSLTLDRLAAEADLSPFHFLRSFERVTGVTPHQYIRRARLRAAARRLLMDEARIIDVALDSGFGDVSNFTRAFRTEFGASPRQFRQRPHRHDGRRHVSDD